MVKNILVPISPVNIVYNEQLTKSYKIAQKYTINYIGLAKPIIFVVAENFFSLQSWRTAVHSFLGNGGYWIFSS
jgi:hypothetical protein